MRSRSHYIHLRCPMAMRDKNYEGRIELLTQNVLGWPVSQWFIVHPNWLYHTKADYIRKNPTISYENWLYQILSISYKNWLYEKVIVLYENWLYHTKTDYIQMKTNYIIWFPGHNKLLWTWSIQVLFAAHLLLLNY